MAMVSKLVKISGGSYEAKPKPHLYVLEEHTRAPGFLEATKNMSVVVCENRTDAHNVNQWHWEERDCTSWCKDRLRDLLLDLNIGGENCSMRVSRLKRFTGDASILNRRGRAIAIYDITLLVEWSGSLPKHNQEVKGSFSIRMAQDEEGGKPVCKMSSSANNQVSETLMDWYHSGKIPARRNLLDACNQFIDELKLGADKPKPSS